VRFVIFTHSLISDWNHGNAHFLRGMATEMLERGNDIQIFEPRNGWSLRNLVEQHGNGPLAEFERVYPHLRSTMYAMESLDLRTALKDADVAIVHEWNDPELVKRIGDYRASHNSLRLFFHDTHHRTVTDPDSMGRYDLRDYDGVLAYGGVIRDLYIQRQWARRAWTWHEAADTRVFYPRSAAKEGDVVWIGNWGDDERSHEIEEFLIRPVKRLGLKAKVYGVRYPQHALDALARANIEYGGWLPNYSVPEVLSRYRVTVHIPRRPYARALPGIPTIRPFEAMACGIPLISAPWRDSEELFRPGSDFLLAADENEMVHRLNAVLSGSHMAGALAASGLETIRTRHTCSHRFEELADIVCAAGSAAVGRGD
jgi:spore maturation protein CgeB